MEFNVTTKELYIIISALSRDYWSKIEDSESDQEELELYHSLINRLFEASISKIFGRPMPPA